MYFLLFISIFSLFPAVVYGMEREESLADLKMLEESQILIKNVQSWLERASAQDEGKIDEPELSVIDQDKTLRRKLRKNPSTVIDSSEPYLQALFEHWCPQSNAKKIPISPKAKEQLIQDSRRQAMDCFDQEGAERLLLNYSVALDGEERGRRGPLYYKEVCYYGKILHLFCDNDLWYLFDQRESTHPDINLALSISQEAKRPYALAVGEKGNVAYLFVSQKPRKHFIFRGRLAAIPK